MKDYTVLRSLSGLYMLLGWVTMLAAVGAFFLVAIQAPDPIKWLSVVAGLGGILIGVTLLGASEVLAAVADTAQSAKETAEALATIEERLDQLIAIGARSAVDLNTLAGTVRKRETQ